MLAGKIQGICTSERPSPVNSPKYSQNFHGLGPKSLRIGTGNLFRPSRELNRAIREVIRLIRESCACPASDIRSRPLRSPPNARTPPFSTPLYRAGGSRSRASPQPIAAEWHLRPALSDPGKRRDGGRSRDRAAGQSFAAGATNSMRRRGLSVGAPPTRW